jgi:hypothetical protein
MTLAEFGDNVRIGMAPATESLGVAGLTGQVYGETTPSVTGVEVVGELREDYAINVFLKDRNESFWFARERVEFVDHAPGTVIQIGDKELARTETGGWQEVLSTKAKCGLRSWLRSLFRRQ